MSEYAPQYPPAIAVKPSVKQFFERFYEISDRPHAHEEYVSQFTAGAVLIMASSRYQGLDEILSLRLKMWEKVSSRKHVPQKIFPFGACQDTEGEVMIYGTLAYVMKDGGRELNVDWAARAHVVEDDGGRIQMDFYQVYLDTAAQK